MIDSSLRTGLDALATTDWPALPHAYGRATDSPAHLEALLAGDEAAKRAALEHLWSAVLRQGTPWPVTAPVAKVLIGLLDEGRLADVRGSVLEFLGAVAEVFGETGASLEELRAMERAGGDQLDRCLASGDDGEIYGDDAMANALYARSVLACEAIRPAIARCAWEQLERPEPEVRAAAAMVCSGLVALLPGDLHLRLRSLAVAAEDPDARAALVLALGACGASPGEFLVDASPGVRLCAALAEALASDGRALGLLLDALERHAAEMDGWFVVRPPQFSMRPRFAVVARVLERVEGFERLAPAATAVARVTTKFCADVEWGPLLARAFAATSGRIESTKQRDFLAALVANEALWDRTFGNATKWFQQAALPYDRAECARRVELMRG